MRARITKRLVDATQAADKPVFVFDEALAGFVLKALPSGKKVYQLRYRMGGRTSPLKTFTIGTHGPLTPDRARGIAEGHIGDISKGLDPAVEKAKITGGGKKLGGWMNSKPGCALNAAAREGSRAPSAPYIV